MPRVKPRRIIGKFFILSFSSFLMFNVWLLSMSDNYATTFLLKVWKHIKQQPSVIKPVKEVKYQWSGPQRPWFMTNGTVRPTKDDPIFGQLYLFLKPENEDDDRIVNQLMYLPHLVDNKSNLKLKKIFLHSEGGTFHKDLPRGRGVFIRDKCPVNTCELTTEVDQAPFADVILFKDRFQMPKHHRPPNQIWILYLLECPLNTQSFRRLKELINWTATYRHDSDLVTPYEKFVPFQSGVLTQKQRRNYAEGKTRKVAWFVSNCGAKNQRLQFARELAKYIKVDIFGSCGDKICSRSKSRDCFDQLNKHYKFYLSFENSNCRDYITEKFYVNGLQNDVIPIVMGAHPDDYQRVSPFNSYIHVDHFDSPKHLADYLNKLDANDTLYNEYFQWKGSGQFINTYFWCRLCAMLHSNPKPKHYADLSYWWAKPSMCNKYAWDAFSLKHFPKYSDNFNS